MSDDELRQLMAAVGAEFRAVLPARIAAIDALWAQGPCGGDNAQALPELIRALHALAGSAGTFGCAAVGDAAAAAEAALEPHRDRGWPPEDVRPEIARQLEALRRAAVAAGQR